MKTLLSLLLKAYRALRDLGCFVLAWALHLLSLGLSWASHKRPTWGWLITAAFAVESWGRSVQRLAPELNGPYPPVLTEVDDK